MADRHEHKILLINFRSDEAAQVSKAGFNVEIGYFGKPLNEFLIPYYTPHPFHDYDVYVYNSAVPDVSISSPKRNNLDLSDLLAAGPLMDILKPPHIRVAFVGKGQAKNLILGGVPIVKLIAANENVSSFLISKQETFSIPVLHDAIANLRTQIVSPVGQYVDWKAEPWPIQQFPVITNRRGAIVGSYGVFASGDTARPFYVALPQLKNNPTGLIEILRALAKAAPDVLPDVRDQTWLDSSEFALPEEVRIQAQITTKIQEAQAFATDKKKQIEQVRKEWNFIKKILVATEDPALPPGERLSAT